MNRSLNPFEFRAGIYFYPEAEWAMGESLNPFEFRAGIYFNAPFQRNNLRS